VRRLRRTSAAPSARTSGRSAWPTPSLTRSSGWSGSTVTRRRGRGIASTRPGHRDDPDVPATGHGELELSYSLAVGASGKGLALEATTAALAWVAPLVPDRHVIAVTQSANTRSVALLRRLGFVEREGFLEFGAEQTLQVLPLAVEPA
jgi:RimJ/RimL family protein N-acetyltransferase